MHFSNRPSVLYVENEEDIRTWVSTHLDEKGFEVISPIRSADNKLLPDVDRTLDGHGVPNLAIVDISIVQGSNIVWGKHMDLVATLLEHNVPLIITTADPVAARLLEKHEMTFIEKPFGHEAVNRALRVYEEFPDRLLAGMKDAFANMRRENDFNRAQASMCKEGHYSNTGTSTPSPKFAGQTTRCFGVRAPVVA